MRFPRLKQVSEGRLCRVIVPCTRFYEYTVLSSMDPCDPPSIVESTAEVMDWLPDAAVTHPTSTDPEKARQS